MMDDLENRVTKLEQQFKDFEKYQGGLADQIREEFGSRVKELTEFFTDQIALIRHSFEEYKKENRKFMLGFLAVVVIYVIAALVKNFLP